MAERQPLRRPEGSTARERAESLGITEEESRRRFIERLTDWSDPNAITIIRDGVALSPRFPVDPLPDPFPVVSSIDDDGNIIMSDGRVFVPRDEERGEIMTSPLIACAFCIHFKPEIRDRNICDAFPEGIPREIARGENHHLEPWPGDNGIRFEPIEGFERVLGGLPPQSVKRQIPWLRPQR